MKTEERITKAGPEGSEPAPESSAGKPRRGFPRVAFRLLILTILIGGLGAAFNYYRLHRPTSEEEVVEIESLIVSGKGDDARALMVSAQVRSRNVDALRLRIGRAFLREGQIGPATALLSRVEGSLIKEERLALAEYFLVKGDPFSAVRFYEAAMRTGMERSASLLGRYGEALSLSANGDGAVAAFRESLAKDDSRTRVRLNLALTLANLNRLDEARVETLALLKIEPKNEKALGLLRALSALR